MRSQLQKLRSIPRLDWESVLRNPHDVELDDDEIARLVEAVRTTLRLGLDEGGGGSVCASAGAGAIASPTRSTSSSPEIRGAGPGRRASAHRPVGSPTVVTGSAGLEIAELADAGHALVTRPEALVP